MASVPCLHSFPKAFCLWHMNTQRTLFVDFFYATGSSWSLESIQKFYKIITRSYEIIKLNKQHHYTKVYLHIDSARNLLNKVGKNAGNKRFSLCHVRYMWNIGCKGIWAARINPGTMLLGSMHIQRIPIVAMKNGGPSSWSSLAYLSCMACARW
jgi:hypothetical protein